MKQLRRGREGQTPGRHQAAQEGGPARPRRGQGGQERRRDKKGHRQPGDMSMEGSAESPA